MNTTTNNSTIPANVGFSITSGAVRRAITVQHTNEDRGKMFIDNFGRQYVHTANGNIY